MALRQYAAIGADLGLAKLILACGLFLVCLNAVDALSFPPLSGRVVDQADIIPPPIRASVESKLKTLEEKSGIQFVVATVDSLQGQEIEDYTNALFRAWGLGEKDKNNGVLLLVAPHERKVRIEPGYGLEGTLTDALSKIIITNAMAPRFKAGDFGGGIERGVDDTIAVLTTDSAEWQKRPELRADREEGPVDAITPWLSLGILLIFIFILIRSPQRGNILSFLLGALLSSRGGGGGGGFSGGSDGGFSGGGGSSGGGGASGSW
jgi:uncharacterized protein